MSRSGVRRSIGTLRVPVHTVNGVLGEYTRTVAARDPDAGRALRDRVIEDESFRSKAMDGINDALVFSTLAAVMVEDDDFEEALDGVEPSGEPMLDQMRIELFDHALAKYVERAAAIGGPDVGVDPEQLNARARKFRETCTLTAAAC